MSIDRLSNMLSTIKNASMAKKEVVEVIHTKECEAVANVLKENGYLTEVKVFKHKGSPAKGLHLELAKSEDTEEFVLSDVKRVSKPGRRLYTNYSDIKLVMGGRGVLVLSTSRGVMSGKDARNKKLGGEILCEVY